MEFTQYSCPVCDKRFVNGDDVVVCPECGAPHHRECFEQLGQCFYRDSHAEGFSFEQGQNTAENEQSSQDESAQFVRCPRCGASFTKYERNCPSCHARMPEPITGTAALTEDAAMFEMMPDYVQKLFETTRLMSHNQKQFFGDFRKAVEGLRLRSENALSQLENISKKQTQASTQAERDAMHNSFELAENGLTKFFNALEIFDSIVIPVDQRAIDDALELVVSGIEDMRQMHTVIQDYRSISGA